MRPRNIIAWEMRQRNGQPTLRNIKNQKFPCKWWMMGNEPERGRKERTGRRRRGLRWRWTCSSWSLARRSPSPWWWCRRPRPRRTWNFRVKLRRCVLRRGKRTGERRRRGGCGGGGVGGGACGSGGGSCWLPACSPWPFVGSFPIYLQINSFTCDGFQFLIMSKLWAGRKL